MPGILRFFSGLEFPYDLPPGIDVLHPFQEDSVLHLVEKFYTKYYRDQNKRIWLIGINPGRFGAGVTGIPFTDPIRLQEKLGIPNDLVKKAELSSRFIHEMIDHVGGAGFFFSKFYITSVSPLGFVRKGKNLNYYDDRKLQQTVYPYAAEMFKNQMELLPTDRRIAFSIGKGKNVKFLENLNSEFRFFDRIESLPHPRWVLQYRLKHKQKYVEEYRLKLLQALE